MPNFASANHCIFSRMESGLVFCWEEAVSYKNRKADKTKRRFIKKLFFIINNHLGQAPSSDGDNVQKLITLTLKIKNRN